MAEPVAEEAVTAEAFVDAPAAAEPVVEVAAVEVEPETVAAVEAAQPIVEQAVAMANAAGSSFLPRAEVVQAVPAFAAAPVIRAERSRCAPPPRSRMCPRQQWRALCASRSAPMTVRPSPRMRWNGMVRRHKVLAGYLPSSMTIARRRECRAGAVAVAGWFRQRARRAEGLRQAERRMAASCFVRIGRRRFAGAAGPACSAASPAAKRSRGRRTSAAQPCPASAARRTACCRRGPAWFRIDPPRRAFIDRAIRSAGMPGSSVPA